MKTEFRRALLGLLLAQLVLALGAGWDLVDSAARTVAFRAQFLSTGNLVALFALSKGLVEFAAQTETASRRTKVPSLIFWGGLKLALLVGLILFLSLQKGVTTRAVLWGIAPWVLGPAVVALLRGTARQVRSNATGT